MASELIVNTSLPETRIVLTEDGKIQELIIERSSDRGIVGNIYKGRVTRVLPGMQAAFVDIGLEKAAFLYVDDVFLHPEGEPPVPIVPLAPGDVEEMQGEIGELSGLGDDEEGQDISETQDLQESENADESGDLESVASSVSAEAPVDDISEKLEATPDPSPEAPDVASPEVPAEHFRKTHTGRHGRRPSRHQGRDKNHEQNNTWPESVHTAQDGDVQLQQTDRADLANQEGDPQVAGRRDGPKSSWKRKPEFRFHRSRNRQIPPKRGKSSFRTRAQVNIQDLLKEGQEVLVQVAKDAIATKGARLTCHVSLPGRHLVCMPTIDHIGVSRRIERDDERRLLRRYVEQQRPAGLGFIVRTASSGKDPQTWIQTDIDYLTKLWSEIKERADRSGAPSLVYGDMNSVLRAVRDWVTEDIGKIIVDSSEQFETIREFVSRFMPAIEKKVELYQGDVPIFDAYGISTEISRALERKVWLKSGGYIVIDQAEALVAIDVNTGRFVGKRSLEDTILKTNLEAVDEIAYQLRLRNCGGIIIIDLIDMEREDNRHRVYRALEQALQVDRARPTIVRMTDLGLIEMTRKRTRDTMVRVLCQTCNHCEGRGFTKSKQTVSYEIMREIERVGIDRNIRKILIQAHPEVIDVLAIDERNSLDELERRYKKQIYLQAVYDYHNEQFEVSGDERPENVQDRDRFHSQQNRHRRSRNFGGQDRHRGRGRHDSRQDASRQAPDHTSETAETAQSTSSNVDSAYAPQHTENQMGASSQVVTEQSVDPGYQQPYSAGVQGSHGSHQGPQGHQGPEDEEDRLAFLRAQAAQDAAIAALGVNGEKTQNGNAHPRSNHRPHRGGRGPNNRNHRGGSYRGGRGDHRGGGGGGGYRGNNRGPYRPQHARRPEGGHEGAVVTAPITPVREDSDSGNGGES